MKQRAESYMLVLVRLSLAEVSLQSVIVLVIKERTAPSSGAARSAARRAAPSRAKLSRPISQGYRTEEAELLGLAQLL